MKIECYDRIKAKAIKGNELETKQYKKHTALSIGKVKRDKNSIIEIATKQAIVVKSEKNEYLEVTKTPIGIFIIDKNSDGSLFIKSKKAKKLLNENTDS